MNFGDKVTIAGVEWTVRPFTPAEHELFDTMAAEVKLVEMAAHLEAMREAKHGTARERLLKADIARIEAVLKKKYLTANGDALREGLTDAERLEAFELASQIDMLQEQIEEQRARPRADLYRMQDEYRLLRESVVAAFMHKVMKVDMPLEEFSWRLTPDDSLVLDEVVLLGKLRAGLSARERQQAAAYHRLLRLTRSDAVGIALESPLPPQDAPEKPGQSGP